MLEIPLAPQLTILPSRKAAMRDHMGTPLDLPANPGSRVLAIRHDIPHINGSTEVFFLNMDDEGQLATRRFSELDPREQEVLSPIAMDILQSAFFKSLTHRSLLQITGEAKPSRAFYAVHMREGVFILPQTLRPSDFVDREASGQGTNGTTLFRGSVFLSFSQASAHASLSELSRIADLAQWLGRALIKTEEPCRFQSGDQFRDR